MNIRPKVFIRILQKYLDNSLRKDGRRLVDIWFDSIKELEEEDLDISEKQKIENRIWESIQEQITDHTEEENEGGNYWKKWSIAAAAVLFISLGTWFYLQQSNEYSNSVLSQNDDIIKVESKDKTSTLVLPDGSKVILEKDSKLFYPEKFKGDFRKVILEGNAFFEITKNPEKPFYVYSGEIITKVLGTSFTIKKNQQSGDIEVAVMTGKVIVENTKKAKNISSETVNEVILTPNEKVVFSKTNEKLLESIVEKPIIIVKNKEEYEKPEAFIFDEQNLSNILSKLQTAYGVEIVVQNKEILNCPVTADLGTESLFSKIEILNTLLNSSSKTEGSRIVIVGGSCVPYKPKF